MDVTLKAASIANPPAAVYTADDIMAMSSLSYVWAMSEPVAHDDRLREQFDKIAEADWLCLYRAAMRAGIEANDAESVVQETLLRAYRRLAGMSTKQRVAVHVHSWLTSIATNVARERFERARQQRSVFN